MLLLTSLMLCEFICSYLYWSVVLTACSYIGGRAKRYRTHTLGGGGVGAAH